MVGYIGSRDRSASSRTAPYSAQRKIPILPAMNSHFSDSERCSSQAGRKASHARTALMALLLLAAAEGTAGTLAAQAVPERVISYLRFSADSALDGVCVGDSVVFNVLAAAGVTINGAVLNPAIGTLKPPSGKSSPRSALPASVPFTFAALLPGQTTLRFTGLPPVAPSKRADRTYAPLARDVEVVACDARNQATMASGAAPVPPAERQAETSNSTVRRIARVTVKTVSTWDVGMVTVARIDDGVMDADDQGRFTGSASVTWQTSVIGGAGCGAAEHPVAPSRAALAGEIDGSSQLVVRITFEPKDFSGLAACGGVAVATSNVGTPSPLTITVPVTGGTSTQRHTVTAKNGSFAGSATVIVTPER